MARPPKPPASPAPRPVDAFTHDAATRRNIPTAEMQSLAQRTEERAPAPAVHYPRARPLPEGAERPRDADRDPQLIWNGARIRLTPAQRKILAEGGDVEIGDAQLVWRGKDTQDWSDLVVQPPPIYVQEKVHPKAIIADLQRQSAARRSAAADTGPDLFADFNGLPDPEARLEFYQHDQHWSNRMILGDSLQVMASLAEREALRGKVQCIYFDPPYGIKFNSNWQVSTQSRDVKDGKQTDISREPEQVKAFRDTWKDGIHSYLTYLRDRLTVARELLTESGSIFVQIGDENVGLIQNVLDEVFGSANRIAMIYFRKSGWAESEYLPQVHDYLLWMAKDRKLCKFRSLYKFKSTLLEAGGQFGLVENRHDLTIRSASKQERSGSKLDLSEVLLSHDNLTSDGFSKSSSEPQSFRGRSFPVASGDRRDRHWKTPPMGLQRMERANRLLAVGNTLRQKRYLSDLPISPITEHWDDTAVSGFADAKTYVVQTSAKVVERCILMATDPGDLVLDPTCGSGTTATVAEQWGRRWITIDTSRVALALARTRIMAARYPYYLLADSREGRAKEAQLTGKPAPDSPAQGDLRQGFVYDRAPHVTLKSIANNAEIDVLWEAAQTTLEPLRTALNAELAQAWEEWQIPREPGAAWSAEALRLHAAWWQARIARQAAIDASIAKRADVELLYDRPYEDRSRVRVAGPFTVESLSPHRVVPAMDEELLPEPDATGGGRAGQTPHGAAPATDFGAMILDHLRTAGVHQHQKNDSIRFTSLVAWPGDMISAEGRYSEGDTERRAGILIGPEFGTLARADLVRAAREATDAGFDVLIACAFNYDAHASDLAKLGPLPIVKARMNPDLHMADDLKNTGRGNLFVVFGEPDLRVHDAGDGTITVQVLGVDVFDPQTGDIRSGGTDSIAAWFIDTMYDEESFRVRHAYFLGAGDPYKSLKTALRAEIDEEAWATLYRDKSRPFTRPETGRIAVKVINHFGDEVMKVFSVS